MIGRVPKKGLGVVSGLGLGDAVADAGAAGAVFGDIPPGVKAFAFALGLNDEALTFKRFAALAGDMLPVLFPCVGPEPEGVAAEVDEAAPLAGEGPDDCRVLLPLKGGMGWMTIAGFFMVASDVGFVVAADFGTATV